MGWWVGWSFFYVFPNKCYKRTIIITIVNNKGTIMVSFSAKTSWVYALSLYSMLECRTEQPGTLNSQSVASGERESTVGSEHKTNILFYLHYKGFLYIFF